MMRNTFSFGAVLTILLLGNQINAGIVENTCKDTRNYNLCVEILQKDPNSSKADVRGLALIMVNALKGHTSGTIAKIENLKKQRPRLRDHLKECHKIYDVVLNYDITEAVEGLSKGNPKFAKNGVADAVIEAQVCEGNFRGSRSPLTEANKVEEDIGNATRDIIRMLL